MLPVLPVKQILANDCDDVISHPLSARFSFLPFFCFFLIIVIVRGVFFFIGTSRAIVRGCIGRSRCCCSARGDFLPIICIIGIRSANPKFKGCFFGTAFCPIRSDCVAWIGSSCVIYCDRAAWKCSCSLRHF